MQFNVPCVTMRHVQDRLKWWLEAAIGDVSFRRREGYHLGSEFLCSFSNVVQHPLPLKISGKEQRGEECEVRFCACPPLVDVLTCHIVVEGLALTPVFVAICSSEC